MRGQQLYGFRYRWAKRGCQVLVGGATTMSQILGGLGMSGKVLWGGGGVPGVSSQTNIARHVVFIQLLY